MLISEDKIRALGFEWPKYKLVAQYLEISDGNINLAGMIAKMEQSRSFYRKQLNDAFKFKMHTGADYGEFTNRFDEYARTERLLAEAIRYLIQIYRSWDESNDPEEGA